LNKISSYLDDEELHKFRQMVKARGITESMFIREMLGFDVRQRGAPKGHRRKKKAHSPKPVKSKRSARIDEQRPVTRHSGESQLSFLD
jgi:hypothetical protein